MPNLDSILPVDRSAATLGRMSAVAQGNIPITILDMEDSFATHMRTAEAGYISKDPSRNPADYQKSKSKDIILNPDKTRVLEVIDMIFENNGQCCVTDNSVSMINASCPCDDLLKHGNCACGLFVRR